MKIQRRIPLIAGSMVLAGALGSGASAQGPAPSPGMPAPGAQQVSIQGKVLRSLYGPAGDVNGALLDDGAIVRVGPREAYLVAAVLNPGATLAAQGWALTTAYGRVVDAQALGPSPGQLTQVAPTPPPGTGFASPRP